MSKFLRDIDQFTIDVQGLPLEVIKKVAFEMYIRVVKRTRYKTGRARGSWLLSVGSPGDSPDRLSSGPDSSEFGKLYAWKGTNSIFLTSNLSYIRPLELGTDKFPGDHMLQRTVAEFKPLVEKMTRQVLRG